MKRHFAHIPALLLIVACLSCAIHSSASAEQKTYQRSEERYAVPDVMLIDQDGRKVRLTSLLQSGKPVVVQFIFASCTTICPVLSSGYVNLQNKLGTESDKVSLISISIDPENDSPKVMKEYLKRYRAKPGWNFLTGSRKDIEAVMRAFKAYVPNKMSHYAVTFIHPPKNDAWIRLNGILSSSELVDETKKAWL